MDKLFGKAAKVIDNGRLNAFRHALWAGLITVFAGPKDARKVTFLHEAGEGDLARLSAFEKAQRAMDRHNDVVGIKLALSLVKSGAGKDIVKRMVHALLIGMTGKKIAGENLWIIRRGRPGRI